VGGELDLFTPAAVDPSAGALSVSMVTSRARQLVEAGFRLVWVKGEVANFKSYRSGHWYFTLRDSTAQVRCVMWRDDNRRVPASPEEGLQVFVECQATVWEERGEFRLTVRRLISTDDGGLWELQLQRARARLEREGLLDPTRKRPIPLYPTRIAVVTSPDGAALRDIVSVMQRRWPAVELLLCPTRVQGEGAAREICRALELASAIEDVDLVIVGRGGGSKEDLWAFNSEDVARAVAHARAPTISAVGHETDVTLTDLVADLRAPTPSAAAEAAVPHREEVLQAVNHVARRLAHTLANRTLLGGERLARTGDRLTNSIMQSMERRRQRLSEAAAKLDALSPLKVLDRGYSVARDENGAVLQSVADFPAGRRFRLTVSDGDVRAAVEPESGE